METKIDTQVKNQNIKDSINYIKEISKDDKNFTFQQKNELQNINEKKTGEIKNYQTSNEKQENMSEPNSDLEERKDDKLDDVYKNQEQPFKNINSEKENQGELNSQNMDINRQNSIVLKELENNDLPGDEIQEWIETSEDKTDSIRQ